MRFTCICMHNRKIHFSFWQLKNRTHYECIGHRDNQFLINIISMVCELEKIRACIYCIKTSWSGGLG